MHFDQDSPKAPTAGWWRRHYGGGIWHQGCEGVCTSVGVGGRGFLDVRRGEFQLNPVNDTILGHAEANLGMANPGLILTVFVIQHPAAHGLFDLLVAAQPHPVHPGTGMVLL